MKRIGLTSVALAVFVTSSVALAQNELQFPSPEKEHQWLEKFAGEWESESESIAAPGQPAMKCKGTMSARMLGGFWIISEMVGDVGGANIHAVQTIGYDPKKKKYVGTWVDSATNHMWQYEGSVDESGNKLTLEAEGPNFMADNKMTKFRDAYEFKSPDHLVITSSMLGEDGKWVTFMTGEARRK